jgi:hypothetical protein
VSFGSSPGSSTDTSIFNIARYGRDFPENFPVVFGWIIPVVMIIANIPARLLIDSWDDQGSLCCILLLLDLFGYPHCSGVCLALLEAPAGRKNGTKRRDFHVKSPLARSGKCS